MNNKIKNAFDNVHAEESLKESTSLFVAEEIRKHSLPNTVSFNYKRFIRTAAAFLFVLIITGGFCSYFIPVSAISIDINPSVEIGINCFDKIVSVKGINEDGRILAESLDIKYLNYSEALDAVLESVSDKEDDFASVTVIGSTDKKCHEMIDSISSEHENVHCHSGNHDEVSTAHETGLSFGKYKAFLALNQLDSSITVQDVKNMTMKQIYSMIYELSGESEFYTEKTDECQSTPTCQGQANEMHGGNGNSNSHGNRKHNGNKHK